ncbi:HlyD family efflux transporter periplasmic adaptor subunit [Thalassotalea litorea]|uniref:HlyD family efflux transporter periplasmic adaptor subunit n=1 Tax=Thalassotalea litorea TaxID=2020715 RepID=A0A5R9IP55_9GAMM|nr:HlyD family efflux transporter periplasmic adaptor subunit [Thalassotalea litorea]TLU66253.1 HlyD family efflux transporter periplasmic adaptor subunit [Thalassotalea litorea]
MDRKIERKSYSWQKAAMVIIAIAAVTFVGRLYSAQQSGKSLAVSPQNLTISSVETGIFEDYIPIRSKVTPLKTVYLDAVEGGRVEQVLIEDGALVEPGQAIVKLSNTQLQLDVMRNEAAVTEQLNNMRSIELSLEQNKLSHKRNLIEINYQLKRLTRQVERERIVYQKGSISESVLKENEDLLEYYQQRKVVTLESQTTDTRLQEQQLAFLQETGKRLNDSLQFARKNMENLNMAAPVAGKLSGFDIEVGQSIERGERIGQIDDPDSFKLQASIDEFYLERIDLGQTAVITRNRKNYKLRVSKIYPQVNNGQFRIDLVFSENQPSGIRRGQTLQTKLTLGDPAEVALIPNGAFYQDSGGHWVFVVSEDGSSAIRRNVRLGRRNNRFIEVIEGLEVNEKVITSPYASFLDMDRLNLKS